MSGSETYRIETVGSALELVRSILERLELMTGGRELVLQPQREVVDEGKAVPKTKVGTIVDKGDRKNRASMTQAERDAEKFIQKEKKEMDRQLKELAAHKNTFEPLLTSSPKRRLGRES